MNFQLRVECAISVDSLYPYVPECRLLFYPYDCLEDVAIERLQLKNSTLWKVISMRSFVVKCNGSTDFSFISSNSLRDMFVKPNGGHDLVQFSSILKS